MLRPSPRSWLLRHGLAACALAAPVGCGGGCAPVQLPAPATTADPAPVAPVPEPLPTSDPPGLHLSAEALSARVAAQRRILGASALFEDEGGRPVPWLPSAAPGSDAAELPTPEDDVFAALPGSSGFLGEGGAPAVDGNTLGGFVPLDEAASGAALRTFYDALRRLQAVDGATAKVRVAVFGASHTDADIYTQYLRTYLQARFGDGGHGFVHLVRPWRWYKHVDATVENSTRWRTEHAQRRDARQDGFFGLAGASVAASRKREWGRVTLRGNARAEGFELHYLTQPAGGSFELYVGGRRVKTISTRGDGFALGVEPFRADDGADTVEVRLVGNGEVRLFGMVAERDAPGVVVDTLGIPGTRAANILAWDETLWSAGLARRAPDLVILAYGTNESTDEDQDPAAYEADLRRVLDKVRRATPRSSCVLVGPGDVWSQLDGAWAPRPRVASIIAIQRAVAAEAGCAHWDLLASMGGTGAMDRWVRSAPPMAKPDYVHLTRRGYVRMGMRLTDALMQGFDP